MNIEINGDEVIIDGAVYRLDRSSQEFWGRKEIAQYLNYTRSDGHVNLSNMYSDCPRNRILFPQFAMELANRGAKPWTKRQCIDWLSIPKKERLRMYKEIKGANDDYSYEQHGNCNTGI